MDLRPLIRINRTAVRASIGKMLSYDSTYSYLITRDTDQCVASACPLYLEQQRLFNELEYQKENHIIDIQSIKEHTTQIDNIKKHCASSGCCHCSVHKKYNNDKKDFKLYQKKYSNKRLPKSALRVYLLLYSIPQETLGNFYIIRDVSSAAIASKLKILPVTVEKSLDILASFNYITKSSGSDKHHFNIIIEDYENMHKKASEGGAGYISITSEMMEILLSIKNVNFLRLELLKIFKTCDLKTEDESGFETYSLKELKSALPSHMNFMNKFKKAQKEPSIFVTGYEGHKILFSLKSPFSFKIDYDDFKLNHLPEIQKTFDDLGIKLSDIELLDVADLTSQYTLSVIYKAASRIKHQYSKNNIAVKNYGALLRTFCRDIYLKAA